VLLDLRDAATTGYAALREGKHPRILASED
jgi:hypothetical protein